jgi:hypothetical protein
MRNRDLKANDVVQINPDTLSAFGGCFMLVTEPKPWGAIGLISMPTRDSEVPGSAYYRATWAEIEYVGTAAFVPKGADV